MENLLSVMMKLRNVKNLDSRQAHLIDGAYFATRPPDKAAGRRRQRPPLEVGGGLWALGAFEAKK
jgi:regulator of nonsense transcripts 2